MALHRGETLVCAVRPSKGIARTALQLVFHGLQIAGGQHAVAVQHYQVFALRTLCAIVARLPGTAVFLAVITQCQPGGMLFDNVLARYGGAVFDHHHLKVLHCLSLQAGKQLVYFVGAVVDGNDEGVSHFVCFGSNLSCLASPNGRTGLDVCKAGDGVMLSRGPGSCRRGCPPPRFRLR